MAESLASRLPPPISSAPVISLSVFLPLSFFVSFPFTFTFTFLSLLPAGALPLSRAQPEERPVEGSRVRRWSQSPSERTLVKANRIVTVGFSMPSKYSHTVVLAQHSSSGLINLPSDQYIDYLTSSPLLTTKPAPQRPSTAPPKNFSRATSTQTNASERLPVQNSLRQHTSSDQLAAGAYRHQASHARPYRLTRCEIVDSDEDDSGDDSDAESHSSRPSYEAYSTRSQNTNLRPNRLPSTLPIELPQQVTHHALLPANSCHSQREPKMSPEPAVYSDSDFRQSVELPIQLPTFSSVRPARSLIPASPVHNRDVSNPKSLTTPQLSRTSTQMTHRDDSPDTPFSSLRRDTPPAMTDEPRSDLCREDSALPQNASIHRLGPTKMPLQANFDGFFDDSEQDLGYFKDPPESEEARKARLINLRAYDAMGKATNDSPRSGTFGSEKNPSAVPDSDSALRPPAQKRYRGRPGSLSSLSGFSDFASGAPLAGQAMGHPNTFAAAVRTAPPSAAYEDEVEAYAARKQAQVSASAKQIELPPSTLPQSRRRFPDFDPNLLDPTAVSFSQFLNSLEFRFSESEPTLEEAAIPPDIARHPPTMLDPLTQLIVDSRGGIASLAAQEEQRRERQRQGAKSGIFSSLRLKGKKLRGELM